jgi:hypothetical protein
MEIKVKEVESSLMQIKNKIKCPKLKEIRS